MAKEVAVVLDTDMAVQGAAPKRISPAMYSGTFAGSIHPANRWLKNSTASAAMVKGLISQLITSVITNPSGRCPTSRNERKSLAVIIG